jgi:opacity protein-like surface antigen
MKRAFVFAVLVLSYMAVRAQDSAGAGKKKKEINPWFAIHAGVNYSGIEGETETYEAFIPGFTAGFRFSFIRFGKNLRINVEANYSEQGGKYKIDNDDAPPGFPRTGKLRLYYVNFPVTLRFQASGGFYCEIGAQAGYLVRAEDKYNGNSTDVKKDYNKFDYDVLGGLGFRINKNWGMGLRVVPGLKNINKKLPDVEANTDRNMVATALVSYYF